MNKCSGKSADVAGFSAAALLLPAVEEAALHQQMRCRQPPTGTTYPAEELGIPAEACLSQHQHVSLHMPQSALQHTLSTPGATPPWRRIFLTALLQQTELSGAETLPGALSPEEIREERSQWSERTKIWRKFNLEDDVLLTAIWEPGKAQPLHSNMPPKCINPPWTDG